MNAPLEPCPAPRILVVEDEPTLRRGLCRLIEAAGYRSLEADCLSAARSQLALGGVDVVVLDIGLPDGNGLSLLKQDALLRGEVPTLVFTSSRERCDVQTALDQGAVGFLPKSTDNFTVSAHIQIAVRQAAERRAAARDRCQLESSLADLVSRWHGLPRGLAAGFCSAWDLRHVETGAHVRRIGAYSEVLALALGASQSDATMLGEVAVLHDIGKIAIPDSILCKPGPLTRAELEIMKRHPVEGARMLHAATHPFFDQAALVARWHHERWDGSGYPDGLRGEEFPRDARIVAVADVYDALGQARCYKAAWSPEEIVAYFSKCSGAQFEAKIVEALFDSLPRLRQLADQFPDAGSFPLPQS